MLIPEHFGRNTGLLFKDSAKVIVIGITNPFGNLLNGFLGVLQKKGRLLNTDALEQA